MVKVTHIANNMDLHQTVSKRAVRSVLIVFAKLSKMCTVLYSADLYGRRQCFGQKNSGKIFKRMNVLLHSREMYYGPGARKPVFGDCEQQRRSVLLFRKR